MNLFEYYIKKISYQFTFLFNIQFNLQHLNRRQGPEHEVGSLKSIENNQRAKSTTKTLSSNVLKEVGNPIFGKIDPVQLFETLVKNNAIKGK